MERPTKRPRFGPGPFQEDDPEADELNERPEEVNARRDPAVQLERSRAFAALKLKSAFERIFEKYERDFTGVGDEIDLRTGEIVVNNGHIQSLKDAQLGGGSDEEGGGAGDSGDEVSEAGSLNGEERIVRDEPDNRLGGLGQNALPSIPPQLGLSPMFRGGWPGPAPLMGPSPLLPTMMYPSQVQFGQVPMQYGAPIPPPTTDPTWSVPELPLQFSGNRLLSGESVVSVKKKAARLSLSAAHAQGGDDDDILLDGSATGQEQEKEKGRTEIFVKKQKVLQPRPPPKTITPRRRRRPRKGSQSAAKFAKIRKAGNSPAGKEKALENRSTDKPGRGRLGGDSTKPNPGTKSQEEGIVTSTEPARIDVPGSAGPKSGHEPRQSSVRDADSESLHEEDADVFINFSDREGTLTRRPQNQTLRVEIVAKKLSEACLFRVLTPEPSEAGSPNPLQKVSKRGGARPGAGRKPKPKSAGDKARLNEAPTVSEVRDASLPVPVGKSGPDGRDRAQAAAVEVFSRNTVDPAYVFSDEDEPTVPRGKSLRRKQSSTPRIADTSDGVLREISHNVDPRVVSQEQQLTAENLSDKTDGPSAVRALMSPTLSLHLEDTVDHGASRGASEQPGDGDIPRAVTETLEEAYREKTPTPHERVERRPRERNSISEAEDAYSIRSSSTASAQRRTCTETAKALPSKARQQKRLDKPQPRDTPTKTLDEVEVQGSEIRDASPTTQERAKTSPTAQPAAESARTTGPSTSDADFLPSEERRQEGDEAHDPIPSPTLTSPTSKPATRSTIPELPLPALRTPVKTPQRHRPKSHKATKSATATAPTTATATKKKGVLSLLPPDDDEEDELSILTPIKPSSGAASIIRSTPAKHHVRSGLLPVWPSVSSASKLKKAVVVGSANRKAAATFGATTTSRIHTPSGRRRKSVLAVSGGREDAPGTPSSRLGSELVETPGGTMRRCGEGGFRCGRDFCFSCCL
ncbi:uncharacterized protein B0T15DRAFT_518572 [Chaetomium strumarium]|uniref:Uncharacterized protein n=1 Tax=Chaetomium strumarium TaxID=1170767 RepID=A0AAJ0M6D0_9PEZI|nr:hypothetical protein B0T15DRAFT_518572 [Chaetomium strumarium]